MAAYDDDSTPARDSPLSVGDSCNNRLPSWGERSDTLPSQMVLFSPNAPYGPVHAVVLPVEVALKIMPQGPAGSAITPAVSPNRTTAVSTIATSTVEYVHTSRPRVSAWWIE